MNQKDELRLAYPIRTNKICITNGGRKYLYFGYKEEIAVG